LGDPVEEESIRMQRKTKNLLFAVGSSLLGVVIAAAAFAEEPASPMPWLDNEIYKLSLDVRGRIELADIDGADDAEAYTLRTRVGLGLKAWHGLSVFGELENTTAVDDDSYFDNVSTPNGKTTIADPEECRRKKPPFSHFAGYGRYVKPRMMGDRPVFGTLFLLGVSDTALDAGIVAGCGLAVAALLGLLPRLGST
jgi:hypothetical protein